MMIGLDVHPACVIGVVILFQLCLCWYLLGPELAIIFAGTTVLGTALNLTPSRAPVRATSRKILPRLDFSPLSLRFGGDKNDPIVIPDTPASCPPRPRKNSKPSVARNLSQSFDMEL